VGAVENSNVGPLAHDTGLLVTLVDCLCKCCSVGRLSSVIIWFIPKVGEDKIGSGWEWQDERRSKSHEEELSQISLKTSSFSTEMNQIS